MFSPEKCGTMGHIKRKENRIGESGRAESTESVRTL